jgi:hypothetical protein
VAGDEVIHTYQTRQPTFRRTMSPSSVAESDVASCFLRAGFLFGLFFEPENEGDIFLLNGHLTFNTLHGVMSIREGICSSFCFCSANF